MNEPILFLRPTSRKYQRDYDFAREVYRGVVPNQAAAEMKMSAAAASKLQQRLRKKAALWAGHPVSDPMIYRLMFDRTRAEAELKETCPKSDNGGANVGESQAS